ncbi:MAG TPA: hypothetical protein PLH02_04600 [Bacillota bacterium]|nr:hypothetical protein [Bacillota bacterium]HPF42500.1 hypothetical protein [Bacillota bacterium]HPQ62129.1 hypothetical protein [Bacillota bacterium]HRX91681.1 hypothetical protein [Candidatus Izemoplasmatales bacterium]
MNEMTSRQIKLVIFGGVTLLCFVYVAVAFAIIKNQLVPSLAEPTLLINYLSYGIMIAFVVFGVYCLLMLRDALIQIVQIRSGIIYPSLLVVLTVLGGVAILADITLLSDIGKEYLQFDVAGEWKMLFGIWAFQTVTIIFQIVMSCCHDVAGNKLTEKLQHMSDSLYVSTFQVMLISSILGLISIFTTFFWANRLPELSKYATGLMIVLCILSVLPAAVIICHLIIRNRRRGFNDWFDERQWDNLSKGGMVTVITGVCFLILSIIVSQLASGIDPGYLLLTVLFAEIGVFSAFVLSRNRIDD